MIYSNTTSPRQLIFYGESEEDLNLMPTTEKPGEGKYDHGLAPKGTIAEILTDDGLKIYMLRSTGWVDVTDTQILEVIM